MENFFLCNFSIKGILLHLMIHKWQQQRFLFLSSTRLIAYKKRTSLKFKGCIIHTPPREKIREWYIRKMKRDVGFNDERENDEKIGERVDLPCQSLHFLSSWMPSIP